MNSPTEAAVNLIGAENINKLRRAHIGLVWEADRRSCETCKGFHAGTYDCRTESEPLSCVMNDYDGWEAKP